MSNKKGIAVKILRWMGILAIGFVISFVGFWLGEEQTTEEKNQAAWENETRKDLIDLGNKYQMAYSLCELKYKHVANEEWETAHELLERQNSILNEIEEIWNKYGRSTKTGQ